MAMKVLIGISCLLEGGTEIQTLSLAKALLKGGYDVKVVCYFEHTTQMVKRYEEFGIDVFCLNPDGIRPTGIRKMALNLWRGLKRVVREVRPDAVHIQYMTPGALAAMIFKALGVEKVIATSHTSADIYSGGGIKAIRLLSRYLLSGFQCISLAAEESYFGTSTYFSGKLLRHFTIYNALPEHITIRERDETERKNVLTIGVVSRLEEIKGMDLVIPAFKKVLRKYQDIRLVIAGDGSLRKRMESDAEDSGIKEKVLFLGRIAQEKLNEVYDSIDILLVPSRSEGFGLTALEGMARGCVPVVANTGGLPEVTGDCGLSHCVDNVESISATLDKLIDNRGKLRDLSHRAAERARIFSIENYNRSIIELYQSLLKTNGRDN
ncbi:MAG: glycosyltransferase family 4 protein [Bacteroidales bacterium]|nr:glycosyltransferase family 4 protein [Bacteroidales bacterium]